MNFFPFPFFSVGLVIDIYSFENQKSHCKAKKSLSGKKLFQYIFNPYSLTFQPPPLPPQQRCCSVNQPRKPQKLFSLSLAFISNVL